jgi:hypothetical protein
VLLGLAGALAHVYSRRVDPYAPLAGYQGFVAAAENPTWAAVILAALGSSALGAIVGGFLTTSLRGRIERDEAWRTRLLDNVAELAADPTGRAWSGRRESAAKVRDERNDPNNTKGPVSGAFPVAGQDLNLRPPGYETTVARSGDAETAWLADVRLAQIS